MVKFIIVFYSCLSLLFLVGGFKGYALYWFAAALITVATLLIKAGLWAAKQLKIMVKYATIKQVA